MGQKCNPKGLRLAVNRAWHSNWFDTKNYSKNVVEDLKIRQFVKNFIFYKKHYSKLEISNIEIVRHSSRLDVTIFASRPGVLIGRKGADIEKLKKSLQKILNKDTILNINISEVKNVDLDANIIAQSIGKMVENRGSYKRAAKFAITKSMSVGAKGIKVKVSGRLNGAEMARKEIFKEGSIPLHTLDAVVDYGEYPALTTYGLIGVSVWVYTDKKSKRQFNEDNYNKALLKQSNS